jgi:general secretion pathway protein D
LAGHDERVTAKLLENVLMLAHGIRPLVGCGALLLQCIIAAFMSYPEWVNLLRKRELFPKQSTRNWAAAIAAALVLSMVLPLAAESAHSLFKKGRDAEARHDVEAAYEFYKQAYDKKPKELAYQASYQRMRFEAAAKKVSRGQMLREQGQLDAALAEFQKAAEIDPASFVAQQEIKRTQQIIQQQQAPQPPPQAQGPPPDNAIKQRLAQAQGPVELQAISDQPITLKLTEDTKVIYETIGKLAGINVLFDPDYTSRRIKIELNGVTLPEALEIVAFESKTFWRPITSNSIFIAADTTAKRKELEQSVVKTFYLSNVSQPTELQDIVNAMRTILEINRIQQLPSQSAIVVRGTPDQVALADKLINDIDKARPEVVVDVAIMQVQKGMLQTLGIQPPSSVTGSLTPANQAAIGGGSAVTAAQLGALKSFSPSKNISVSLPSATVNFLYNDNSTKIIQNPQIRALDGQKASLKIGDRVPVATGSFQPGIGGVGINPLVNTQFQYIDVGVNIDITPRIHANREVTLKLMLDISAVTRTASIGGIDQPVIGQRKIEHEIRLKEGETNLLGGILEDSDVKSLQGFPGLSQIPFFKYLFASEHKEKNQNEIVFLLTPHIVRAQEITDLNMRPLDVGSGSTIELRRAPARPQTQQQPAPQQQQQPAPQANPQQPQGASQPQNAPTVAANQPGPAAAQPETTTAPAPTATADRAILNFDPPNTKQTKGQTFTVNLLLSSQQQMHSFSVQLQYDPKLLQLANISNGGFLSSDGQAVAIVHRDDSAGGKLQITATRPPGSGGVTGNGSVFTLTFVGKATGETTIAPIGLFPRDEAGTPIMMSAGQATVSIQ